MSIIANTQGQPAQFPDNLQADTLFPLTSGNGVQLQGRTSGTAIPAGCVGEYKEAACTAQTSASSATLIDVTGMSIELTAGRWVIGYDVATMFTDSVGRIGGALIRTSGGTVVSKTEGITGYTTAGSAYASVSRRTCIDVSTTTTYKVSIRCQTGATFNIMANSITGQWDDDDNNSVIWAQRIA